MMHFALVTVLSKCTSEYLGSDTVPLAKADNSRRAEKMSNHRPLLMWPSNLCRSFPKIQPCILFPDFRASVMSDMEASLMQGIRLRFLDLGFSLNRQSSWKGLAQVCARVCHYSGLHGIVNRLECCLDRC